MKRLIANRYELIEPVGQGAMGTVWRARDELLDRIVAVKEVRLRPDFSDEERADFSLRMMREARAAGRLTHPGVVVVHDVVEEDGRPWIVMQYVPSRSLGQVVREDGPLAPEKVADIGLQVLTALGSAHDAGVMHRDVKPENVLLAEDGRVVLTDFGIATIAEENPMTRTGLLLGTPSYIAPERAGGASAKPASDLWSLGATLYTAVEGRPPFDRGAPLATITAVMRDDPEETVLAGPLAPVLAGLLRKDPAERLGAERTAEMLREVVDAAKPRPGFRPRLPSALGRLRPEPREPAAVPVPPPVPAPDAGPPVVATGAHLESPPARLPWSEGEPEPEEPGRERVVRGRTLLLIVPVALVVALVAGWLGVREADDGEPVRPPGAASPSAGPETPAGKDPPEGKTTPDGETSGPDPAEPTGTPSVSPTPSTGGVPEGWRVHRDPTGFSVAVPKDWRVIRRAGTAVYIQPPDGGSLLLIDQTTTPKSDPVKDWKAQEKARKRTWPGYKRVRIAAVDDYFKTAADWEFTYDGRGGRLHVVNRGFVTGKKRGYAIFWRTKHSRWAEDLRLFDSFTATFQPAK
ncbi:serine/threonine-protein kinase [Rhizohabitans arisaemae]|uniref:serine/threonine-protein kinase n=1 Tax=Rhizohabitans arisaemae TaxID=2720610 RepID=UPI0024B2328B|nr:serine/threonine-protein kinase [Rhizohabitans arisaemae]